MPLSLVDLQTPQAKETIQLFLTNLLAGLNFPVEAWQDEGAARSLVEAISALGAEQTKIGAEVAKAMFLSTSVADFLDALAKSHFDEVRGAAVASIFDVDMINSGTSTYTPAAGEVTVRASNGAIFLNTAGATISASATTVVEFKAQIAGSAGNVPVQTLDLVTPLAGVLADYDGTVTTAGAEAERDPQLQERCRTKWAALEIETIAAGVINLARNASANIFGVSIDDLNPRGPGTVDVYLGAENATAGAADVALVQTQIDARTFGNGDPTKEVLAIAAPTLVQNVAATVYVQGTTSELAETALGLAWDALLLSTPIGGFDLSPGPMNIVQTGQISDALSAVFGTISVDVTVPASDLIVPPHTKVLKGTTTFTVVQVAAPA